MIFITEELLLDENELAYDFVRAAGPGGQNVNKVATAVQLRFDVVHSPSLPEPVRHRLIRLAGKRLTSDGVLIIEARRFRTQEQNRQDALQRLVTLLRRAAEPAKPRRPTQATRASQERRLKNKRQRSQVKAARRTTREDEA